MSVTPLNTGDAFLPLLETEKSIAKIEVFYVEDANSSDGDKSERTSDQIDESDQKCPKNFPGRSRPEAEVTEPEPLHEVPVLDNLSIDDTVSIDILPDRVLESRGSVDVASPTQITLSNDAEVLSELVLDYGLAVGGTPTFEIAKATSAHFEELQMQVTYSETLREVTHSGGDGPFFLFSNAMDSYRCITHTIKPSKSPQTVTARHAQRSQRYQRIRLLTPNSSIAFGSIGFNRVRPEADCKASFSCSDPLLNKIWSQGVRTVDMCTVHAGETEPAWDVTQEGTRVYGQHWAPCRQGTRWDDCVAKFDVRIEKGGASWGVHMVANGLVFCLDVEKRKLSVFEGLSCESSVFPSVPRGEWEITEGIDLMEWVRVEAKAEKDCVEVSINGSKIADIQGLDLHPLLGGAANNSGSIAFGGPESWIATYRDLSVADLTGEEVYSNSFLPQDKQRTFVDFAIGTNELACTMDGAKRDRATFGGDLHIMGRSIAYSTADFDAVRGSIRLLTSHQTKDGYLGNLCPIQAPVHEEDQEPPTYAFYSLTYALLLVVAIKDYWMHTGDHELIEELLPKLKRMLEFAESFVNEDGLVAAPPPLSLTFFPLVGPVFGVSTQINLAFYDALRSMEKMTVSEAESKDFHARADVLKENIVRHLWDPESGVLRLGLQSSPTGVAQDVNAYGISLGVSPTHDQNLSSLQGTTKGLPPAFNGLGARFDDLHLCSPYSTAFAVEACFAQGHAAGALDLICRVWGIMADESNPNFSACHWEAMTLEGKPYHNSTSLVHGWSTGPVYLLPTYLAGLRPVEPGWRKWEAKPIYAGLSHIKAVVPTLTGQVEIEWTFNEDNRAGTMSCEAPAETEGRVSPPEGWVFVTADQESVAEVAVSGERLVRHMRRN